MIEKRGVTLVELLVAMTIFVLIMLGFYTVFRAGMSSWRRGEAETELIQNTRIALDRMGEEIRQALIDPAYDIPGSHDEITFYLPSDAGPYSVRYFLADDLEIADPSYKNLCRNDSSIHLATYVTFLHFKEEPPAPPGNPEARSGSITITLRMAKPEDPDASSTTAELAYSKSTNVKIGTKYGRY